MERGLARAIAEHPLRHVLQNAALRLPFADRAQERRATTGAMNDVDLVTEWAGKVRAAGRAAGISPEDATYLELGPGHSLGVAVALLLSGCSEVTALDVQRFADPDDLETLRPIAERLGSTTTVEQALARLRYVVTTDAWPLPDESIDIVYSFYSGEHLRRPDEVLDATLRVLRPGGLCIHAIDLRDHYHFDGNWLKFLEYRRPLWEAMTSRRGRWTNRLRAPQWRPLFETRFDLLAFEEHRSRLPAGFDRARLARPYLQMSDDALSVEELWVVARKLHEPRGAWT